MRKEIFTPVKTSFPRVVGIALVLMIVSLAGRAQQHIISQKDNTRPETTAWTYQPASIRSLIATKWNGYNEIQWAAAIQQDTRKYIIEYSLDGINFQSAGEVIADKNFYSYQHKILEDRPMLYRIRSEVMNGKSFYSMNTILDGVPVAPVRIYPTVITGQTVNAIADWPVERIIVTSTNGAQVYIKEVGGLRDNMSFVIPQLAKGMYFVTFYGRGWKSTSKFLV